MNNSALTTHSGSTFDELFSALVSCFVVLLSTTISWFSKTDVSALMYLSVTAGTMVAMTHLYGRSGVIGVFVALIIYYSVFREVPSGIGYLYTLIITISLFIVAEVFDNIHTRKALSRTAFCAYVFWVPGAGALFLALFAPSYFSSEQAFNLYLSDSIGILITAPLVVLGFRIMDSDFDIKAWLNTLKSHDKSTWVYKSLLVSAILVVLCVDASIPGNSYHTFLILTPLMILAVFNFAELTQVVLMVLGYYLLFEQSDLDNLTLLNTKLSLFAMFSLCIYIVLDYKLSLKQQVQQNLTNLYNDAQSGFGTFQKLDATAHELNDFIVAAFDMRSIFKYPLEKRDRKLRQIALFFRQHTNLHERSFMLYDISSLVILLENSEEAIEELHTLPARLSAYLTENAINSCAERLYYCHCQKGIRIKQTVNTLNANMRLAERNSNQMVVNCDSNKLDDYIALFENLDDKNIALLRQNYLNIHQPERISFELLSRFIINDRTLNTARVFQYAQKLGYLEHLEKSVVTKQLAYLATLTPSSYDKASINLTPEFLGNLRSVSRLIENIQALKLQPEKLTIEIVETGDIENPQTLHEALLMLKAVGLKLALDDFGAGHASYNQLLTMPVDSVKIDGSLVRNCLQDTIKQKIIENLRMVADTLSLEVVAECVETEEEVNYLKAMGIDYIQGFLVHKPTEV